MSNFIEASLTCLLLDVALSFLHRSPLDVKGPLGIRSLLHGQRCQFGFRLFDTLPQSS